MMGGIFGMIGSLIILAMWSFSKRHSPILVIGLAFLIDQIAKTFLEGFYTRLYLSGALDGYITALQLISWIGFMLYFARIKESDAVIQA
jgi:hypothetical protein